MTTFLPHFSGMNLLCDDIRVATADYATETSDAGKHVCVRRDERHHRDIEPKRFHLYDRLIHDELALRLGLRVRLYLDDLDDRVDGFVCEILSRFHWFQLVEIPCRKVRSRITRAVRRAFESTAEFAAQFPLQAVGHRREDP